MGLFKKKNKENQNNANNKEINSTPIVNAEIKENLPSSQSEISSQPINQKEEINIPSSVEKLKPVEEMPQIEVLNLEDEKKKLETKIEKKKDLRFLISLFGIVIIFILCMPTLRSLLIPETKIKVNTPSQELEESGNLEHGYIAIDKTSFKRVEDIKFYDFKRYEGNMIVFSYMPDKTIKNADELNIFIEVVDNMGIIIHKEKFSVESKIKKEAAYTYSMNLSDVTYKASYYIKIEVLEPKNYNKTIVCSNENKNDEVKTNTEINYNFVDNMLMSYTYNQSFIMLDTTISSEKYSEKYKEQYDLLKQTNIKNDDVEYKEDTIYYKIDYSYFDLGELEFKTKYSMYDYYDYILKIEKSKGWTCE